MPPVGVGDPFSDREGVDGSSPSEGSPKTPHVACSRSDRLAKRVQRAANSSQRRRDRGTPMPRKPSRKALVIGGGPHMYTQTSARLSPAAAFSAVGKPSRSA